MKKCKLCSGKGQRMRKGGYLKSHVEQCDRCHGTGFVDEYLRKPYPQTGYANRYKKDEDIEKLKDGEQVLELMERPSGSDLLSTKKMRQMHIKMRSKKLIRR